MGPLDTNEPRCGALAARLSRGACRLEPYLSSQLKLV